MYEPIIKWTGSKRSQAEKILTYFPKEIDTYYEPFCGGASVLKRLLSSDIKVKQYICSDINKDLIDLWDLIKKSPKEISDTYKIMWHELNIDDNIERKKVYFNQIRNRYNKEHNPLDFMFIMRTTTNGMPRYNSKGDFNNSFHITRNGIEPNRFEPIIYEWSSLLNQNDVQFIHTSYEKIQPRKYDFLYLDPPYANTKGMYYGKINYNQLWDWLLNIKCGYVLSFDGISGNKDNTQIIPNNVYDKHEYLLSGNSSFKRTIGKSNDSIVYESIYIKSIF